MKIRLNYFTGTGNSLRILTTCKEIFERKNYEVEIKSITEKTDINADFDLVGFCFPVYAFGLPRVCREYLNDISKQPDSKNAFLLVTCGEIDEVGFALDIGKKILKKKNYNVTYSDAIHMPANWVTFITLPEKKEAETILEKAKEKTGVIANNIINNKEYHRQFNIPEKLNKFGLYRQHYLFHRFGIYNMWKMFRVYDSCNSCGACSEVCPTDSIVMKDGKPKWVSSCEQCMRCVNYCKQEAIYQTYGGNTKGKSKYIEPGFKPLKQ